MTEERTPMDAAVLDPQKMWDVLRRASGIAGIQAWVGIDAPSDGELRLAAQTDVGHHRANNEDAHVVLSYHPAGLPFPTTVMVLADGVGGEDCGEVASNVSVKTVAADLFCKILVPNSAVPDVNDIVNSITLANDGVLSEKLRRNMPTDMATTIVVAVLSGRTLHIANVGDSRAYLLDKDGLRQITEDHTLMAELVRLNRIDPEKARTHHMRHIITRVVGKESKVEPASQTLTVSPDDVILLCSDGLTDMLEDAEIEKILRGRKNSAARADALVEAALQAGGRDNVTVVLASVPANPAAADVPVLSICHTGQFRTYTNRS